MYVCVRACVRACVHACVCVCLYICVPGTAIMYYYTITFVWTYRSKLIAKTQSLFKQTMSPPVTDAEIVTKKYLGKITLPCCHRNDCNPRSLGIVVKMRAHQKRNITQQAVEKMKN